MQPSVKLNPLTQPQKLKPRQVFIEVCMFLILIVVEVMNKQRMVIMDKIDVSNFLVLGMEKLEDDKMMNPHGLYTLLFTFIIHIILMWRNKTTISKLFNISNTRWSYSINFLTKPSNLTSCSIAKKIQGTSSCWFMQKWISIFWFSWNISLSDLFPNSTSLSVDRYFAPQGAGEVFELWSVYASNNSTMDR